MKSKPWRNKKGRATKATTIKRKKASPKKKATKKTANKNNGITPSKATEVKVEKVFESLGQGSSLTSACQAAGLDRTTFWRWKNSSEDNAKRYYSALDSRTSTVEDALYKNAVKGKVIAQIFYLKNRDPGRWKDEIHEKVEWKDIKVKPPRRDLSVEQLPDDG